MIRIALFTVEELTFVPTLLTPLLEKCAGSIVRAFVSNFFATDARFLRRRLPFFLQNGYPFCIRPGDWVRYIKTRLQPPPAPGRSGPVRTVTDFLRSYGVETESIREIRSDRTLDRLRGVNADVFLFCPFAKIAGTQFLAIPKLGTFNVHLGKLPAYKGGLSAFWVLKNGDPEHGAAIHRVVEEVDGGDIVMEVRVPVRTRCMRDLMMENVRAAGPKLVEALDLIERGGWAPVDISGRPSNYLFFPAWRDFQEFYGRGCRLI